MSESRSSVHQSGVFLASPDEVQVSDAVQSQNDDALSQCYVIKQHLSFFYVPQYEKKRRRT